MKFIIFAVSFLKLQVIWVKFMRLITGEAFRPKSPLPKFKNIDEAVQYIHPRYEWRQDKLLGLPVDWITHPEVTQNHLETNNIAFEDCDGYHYWMAEAINTIPLHTGLTLSVMWRDGLKFGGHTVCVAELPRGGVYSLINYRQSGVFTNIISIVKHVHFQHAPETSIFYWALQNTSMKVLDAGGKV